MPHLLLDSMPGEVSALDPASGEFRAVAMADEALRTPF